MVSTAERMFILFRGHSGGHGTYTQEERTPGRVKAEIKKTARTLREPVTPDLWQQHIDGSRPLGVIPVNSDAECIWGVIDVDRYDLSHSDIAKKIEHLKLPVIVCRSKSGGAHLFVFLKEAVAASTMITKLREWAAVLGYGDCEIFPKQTEILEDRGDLGNWLNMPYFDAERGNRYAVMPDGRGLSIDKFLDYSEGRKVSVADFIATQAGQKSDDEALEDGPPCLQYLAGVKVSEGGRNNALFAFGVLAKKKYPDSWELKLEDWNRRFLDPPLSSDETLIVLKSLRKKDYIYRCKDQPICSHCDAQTCRNRRFGVGGQSAPELASISILDTNPPLFFVCLTSGGTVECKADDVLNSRSFQHTALEQLRVLLPLYKQDVWQKRVQECLDNAVLIEAPHEVSSHGAFHDLFEQFCTDRHAAQDMDEILLGKPYLDRDADEYFFRLRDLTSYLEREKFKEMSRNQISARIRALGGKYQFLHLKGKGVNLYHIPASVFSVQSESHKTPRGKESPI